MNRCIKCGCDYERRPGGDIMLAICYECRAKPPTPEPYINLNGLLVPNPEAAEK